MGSNQHAWADLPSQLKNAVPKFNNLLLKDPQFQAFANTPDIKSPITFGIKAAGSDNAVLVTLKHKSGVAETGSHKKAVFTLSALPEQWQEFFKPVPEMPYQSYWGMFGMNIKQDGIEILGDQLAFNKYTHFWRRALEVLHDSQCGPMKEDSQPQTDEDHIVGKYLYTRTPVWGRCKFFCECSGKGEQQIVFLHTAGSDSRQYHGFMNNPTMRQKCSMIIFDLPGHGRSFPSELPPGAHTNTEDSYIGAITAMLKALKLNKPIICGASMAGQVCLAVAIGADEVGAGGTIPLQCSDYLNMERQFHDRSPHVNQSLYNPEWICGVSASNLWSQTSRQKQMMCPTAPLENRQLIWHLYSAQAYGIFHGDLDFYFGGWNGRSRVGNIDTKKCPIFMLTGKYDWSNTQAMAQATCDKIPGAKHKSMPQFGHFPATENPAKFVPHLLEAIDYIQETRKG